MPIDDYQLYKTLSAIQDKLTFEEAGAIVDVIRMAAMADGKTTIDEMTVLVTLRRILTEFAGGQMPHPSVAIDASRLEAIGHELVATGPRELAFACAVLVMMHDLELAPGERDLVTGLAQALAIEPARAKELAGQMESLARGTA